MLTPIISDAALLSKNIVLSANMEPNITQQAKLLAWHTVAENELRTHG